MANPFASRKKNRKEIERKIVLSRRADAAVEFRLNKRIKGTISIFMHLTKRALVLIVVCRRGLLNVCSVNSEKKFCHRKAVERKMYELHDEKLKMENERLLRFLVLDISVFVL